MKIIKSILLFTGMICSLLSFQSCLDDDDTYENKMYPNALVTVKQSSDKTVFLQLDDKTTLLPVNVKYSPFGNKEVRALVNYKEVNESNKEYTKAVYINWIDSIRTKNMAPNLASKNDSIYGTDPVEIIRDWVTIAEDGYLTLRFRAVWGNQKKIHYVNLLVSDNPDNPYEVEFRHNASGDVQGKMMDALVAFKLDRLPDTKGKTVKLKLKWESFNGEKYVEFDYVTHKIIPAKSIMVHSADPTKLQ